VCAFLYSSHLRLAKDFDGGKYFEKVLQKNEVAVYRLAYLTF
jgi:hypothetical protein